MVWMVWAVACGGLGASPSPDPVGVPDDPPIADSRPDDRPDTAWPDFDTGRADDPGTVLDVDIGPTALDGAWVGTFSLRETVPFVGNDPACVGDVRLVIDGTARRHVQATFACTAWDPNAVILGFDVGYGDLTGVGFATLDPANLSRFRLDFSFGAPRMTPVDADEALVRVDGETLVLDWDDLTGLGPLLGGREVEATLTREVLP